MWAQLTNARPAIGPGGTMAGGLLLGWLAVSLGCQQETRSLPARPITGWESPQHSQVGALRLRPEPKLLPVTHFASAQLLEKSGDWDGALEQYRQAIALNHDYTAAYERLGLLLDQLGRFAEAEWVWRQAVARNPDTASLHNNFGFHYLLQRRYAEAAAQFDNALMADPTYRRARINLGITLAQMELDQEALEMFRQALPEAHAQYNLALVLRQNNRLADARCAFQAALNCDPHLKAARVHLTQLEPMLAVLDAQEAERETRAVSEAPEAMLAGRESPAVVDQGREAAEPPEREAPEPEAEAAAIAPPQPDQPDKETQVAPEPEPAPETAQLPEDSPYVPQEVLHDAEPTERQAPDPGLVAVVPPEPQPQVPTEPENLLPEPQIESAPEAAMAPEDAPAVTQESEEAAQPFGPQPLHEEPLVMTPAEREPEVLLEPEEVRSGPVVEPAPEAAMIPGDVAPAPQEVPAAEEAPAVPEEHRDVAEPADRQPADLPVEVPGPSEPAPQVEIAWQPVLPDASVPKGLEDLLHASEPFGPERLIRGPLVVKEAESAWPTMAEIVAADPGPLARREPRAPAQASVSSPDLEAWAALVEEQVNCDPHLQQLWDSLEEVNYSTVQEPSATAGQASTRLEQEHPRPEDKEGSSSGGGPSEASARPTRGADDGAQRRAFFDRWSEELSAVFSERPWFAWSDWLAEYVRDHLPDGEEPSMNEVRLQAPDELIIPAGPSRGEHRTWVEFDRIDDLLLFLRDSAPLARFDLPTVPIEPGPQPAETTAVTSLLEAEAGSEDPARLSGMIQDPVRGPALPWHLSAHLPGKPPGPRCLAAGQDSLLRPEPARRASATWRWAEPLSATAPPVLPPLPIRPIPWPVR